MKKTENMAHSGAALGSISSSTVRKASGQLPSLLALGVSELLEPH